MEDLLIRKIKGIILGIKAGTKTPANGGAGEFFTKLKKVNEPMHDDLMNDYKQAVKIYNEKNS